MAFEYRFNVIRFYSKLNRFVLSPRKKPNHFVLKIRPGGFADYTKVIRLVLSVIHSMTVWQNNIHWLLLSLRKGDSGVHLLLMVLRLIAMVD